MNKETRENLASKVNEFLKYETDKVLTWCSGCGNYAIQNAVIRALVLEEIPKKDIFMCFDIGCVGNGADKIEVMTLHGLHGRVISVGAGAALANNKMKVIAFAGDGGTFSEGVNHLIHAIRNNYPMVFVHHNNSNYGLTTGQASAVTRLGTKMNGTAGEVSVEPINTLELVLSLKPSFVARSFSGDVDQMTDVFRQALNHNGFAYVEILQSCPTYNKATPESWYADRVRQVENKPNYDISDIWEARKAVLDIDNEIYTGVLYKDDSRPSFFDTQAYREGEWPSLVDEVRHYPIEDLV